MRPIGHFSTASETWLNVVKEIQDFHESYFQEKSNLRNLSEHTRFLHVPVEEEPRGLTQDLQNRYRRCVAIKKDVEICKNRIFEAIENDMKQCADTLFN